MNSKQAKALTRLVQHCFIVTIHSVEADKIFVSISCVGAGSIDSLKKLCYPARSFFWLPVTEDRLAGYVYKN